LGVPQPTLGSAPFHGFHQDGCHDVIVIDGKGPYFVEKIQYQILLSFSVFDARLQNNTHCHLSLKKRKSHQYFFTLIALTVVLL